MDEIDSLRQMYNGVATYYLNLMGNLNNNEDITKVTEENIINALIASISFDIIFRKEQIVEKAEGLSYKSKLSDNELDTMLNYINNYNNKKIFEDSATMLAFIRNKLAHGDYHIDLKNNRLCFKRDGEDVFVDIKILIDFYVGYSKSLQHRFRGKTFEKKFILNKGAVIIKKPIENDSELESFLALYKIKKYSLRKINGEDLTSEEKRMFLMNIEFLKYQLANGENERVLDRQLRDIYIKSGYIVDINNSKIKDESTKQKIKESIKVNNRIAKENNYSTELLIYEYGECINKIIGDYSKDCIEFGLDANEYILQKMYYNKIYDFKEFLSKESTESKKYIFNRIYEIYVAVSLIRFYSLYCYPLECIYKNNKIYHMDRYNLFPFDKLDLSEFKPDVININKTGLKEAKDKLRFLGKSIISKNNRLNEREKNIIGLSKKCTLNNREAERLNDFKKEVFVLKQELDQLYDMYMEMSQYYNYVEKDYECDYFRNKTIIEGMRDALSHANIRVSNIGISSNIRDLNIEFNDIYEGKVEFNLKTNFYSIEKLYEDCNLNIIDNYIQKVKLNTLR